MTQKGPKAQKVKAGDTALSMGLWGGARPEREMNLKGRSRRNKNNLLRGLGGESEHYFQSKDVNNIRVPEAYFIWCWYVACRL